MQAWIAIYCCLFSLFIQVPCAAQTSSVTVLWNANPETNIAGYKLYRGTASGVYTQITDVGNVTSTIVSNLATGTDYYFAVTAYNTAGVEGPPSTEVKTIHNDANLLSLQPSSGMLAPGFAGNTLAYSASVTETIASITLTPTPSDGAATMTVNAVSVPYGTASQSIALNYGSNSLTTVVTARDATTKKTYTITLTRFTPRETWRQLYFGTIANAGPAADSATPQNDGIKNLMKFATAMDPTKRGIQPGALTASGGNLVFKYTRNKAAIRDGMSLAVKWSDSMIAGSWSSTGVGETFVTQGDTELVTVTVPMGTNKRRFLRLEVTSP